MHIPLKISLIFVIYIVGTNAGKGDTYDDLKVALGNLDFSHSYVQVPIETLEGQVPQDLSGTFARHGCGAFGNAANETEDEILDRVDHLFDCIEIDQSFSFHDGQAYFSSRFYDTNIARIFKDIYDQDMHESSVYFGTILGRQNDTAKDLMNEEMHAGNRAPRVSAVSWWTVGSKVFAMSEYKDGAQVDPHNLIFLGGSNFGKGLETAPSFPECNENCHISTSLNPAHETYDKDLGLISTTGMYWDDHESEHAKISRVVYNILPNADGQMERHIFGEIVYEDINTTLCWTDDHPDPSYNLRYLHTIAATKNYVIIPETSFTEDPCKSKNWNTDNFEELYDIPGKK